jgi:3-methyladenine DNA glycosylase Tag
MVKTPRCDGCGAEPLDVACHDAEWGVPGADPKARKRAGFRFIGPTQRYAFMQSAGLVNDHLRHCHRHAPCRKLGRAWSA